MGLDKVAAILVKMEHHWKTELHWNIEQMVTIGIPNMLGIPAPTVLGFIRCLHYSAVRYSYLHSVKIVKSFFYAKAGTTYHVESNTDPSKTRSLRSLSVTATVHRQLAVIFTTFFVYGTKYGCDLWV